MEGPFVLDFGVSHEERSGRSENATSDCADCELCQSENATMVVYGLQVCRSCENEYLP